MHADDMQMYRSFEPDEFNVNLINYDLINIAKTSKGHDLFITPINLVFFSSVLANY